MGAHTVRKGAGRLAIGAAALVLATGCGVKADKVESLGATTTSAPSASLSGPTTSPVTAMVPATAATDATETTLAAASTDTTGSGDTTTTAGDATSPVQEATNVDWEANATIYAGEIGLRVRYRCPPNGTPGTVWGSGPFTDDSSVCTAAVSAGLITLADGGKVVIRIDRGLSAYVGSTRHGITTSDYGSWDSSFSFIR